MRLIFYSLICSLIFSCNDKPEGIIEKNKMISVLYDLHILNQYKTYGAEELRADSILPRKLLFRKHEIDSLTFSKSIEYYGANLKVFAEIYKEVFRKLDKKKSQIIEKEKSKKD